MNQAYEFFEALASGNLTRILFILFVQILAIIIVGLRHEVWRWLINRRVLFKIILSLFISVVTTLLFKRSLVLSLLGYSSAAVIAVIGLIFSENVIFPENLFLKLIRRKYEALDFNEGQSLTVSNK